MDWNFIQTVPLERCDLPADWDLLIPDETAHEIIDKPDGERASAHSYLDKFIRFCNANRERIWIGFTPGVICNRRPRGGVNHQDLFHASLSSKFRKLLADPTFSTVGFVKFARSSEAHGAYGAGNENFNELTSMVREWLNNAPAAEHARFGDRQWLLNFVRDPKLLLGFLHNDALTSRRLSRSELAVFPDRSPYGVWSRLMVWYSLRRARLQAGSAKDMNFPNSYADAACAFLARYTGHLLTDDRELREATEAVASGVRLYRWSQELGRIVPAESQMPQAVKDRG